MDKFREVLAKYWGYSGFRPLQEEIIRSVAEGRDTLGLMPTGGGKSITFQVPALTMEGICLVVTPLIALMKDQVENLRRLGVKATAVYSGMSREEIIIQLENCIFGGYKFLYVSPERLTTDLFRAKLRAMQVSLLVVDESHCISQWGYDFRPSYLAIADIRPELPGVPVLALTATATPEVVDDIQERLHFREKRVFRMSFARANLSYIVRHTEDKIHTLLYILSKVPGTAIVYVRSRKRTKEVADLLRQAGVEADFFHAGLSSEEKTARQERWKQDACRVIVATNAFGMGIDKPDVRLVVHWDMPGSLEEYYQEAGRAGRDGKHAYAVFLYGPHDKAKLKSRITNEFPDKAFIFRVYEALGNYYQIAVGFGLDTVHEFHLEEFCAAYKFSLTQTHHALTLLELAGYIEYTEEEDNVSRLMFYATRDELYQALRQDKRTDAVVQAILRLYTGLFADYVYIDEDRIAKRAQLSVPEVYDTLVGLSKTRILSYIPHKRCQYIIYRQTREEMRYLSLPRSVYEERKERDEKRVAKVLEYIDEKQRCRVRLLLAYFGETEAKACGCCDICLDRKYPLAELFPQIRGQLISVLSASPGMRLPLSEIVSALAFPKEKVLEVVRYLLEHDSQFGYQDEQLLFTSLKN
ncbi:MAG: ATP-dependent DNA helicase RecQ [Parabacteroides sp.]